MMVHVSVAQRAYCAEVNELSGNPSQFGNPRNLVLDPHMGMGTLRGDMCLAQRTYLVLATAII